MLVATCQIILDVLRHGYVSISELNIIVFDECHNAAGNHPMAQLMALYHRHPHVQRPRIIGMSGSLLTNQTRPDKVLETLGQLEALFDAQITTVASTDEFVNVLVHSAQPVETVLRFQPVMSSDTAHKRRLNTLVDAFLAISDGWPLGTKVYTSKTQFRNGMVKVSKTIRSLFGDFQYQLVDLGMYGASLAAMSLIVELELLKRSSSCDVTVKRQLCRMALTLAERLRHAIVAMLGEEENAGNVGEHSGLQLQLETATTKEGGGTVEPSTEVHSSDLILSESSPKVLTLLTFLRQHLAKIAATGTELRCLIFVQRRQTAKLLYHVLRNYAAAEPVRFPIRPDFMVGSNTGLSESLQAVLENKWNQAVLDRFRRSETNLIVATSVLEEGIDLQMCNLVVSYDVPMSYRSYVQSKGRARMVRSTYLVLVPIDQQTKVEASLESYRQVELVLRRYLVGKTVDFGRMQVGHAWHALIGQQGGEGDVPLVTKAGAMLDASGALALVNRYCMTLPKDQYTKSIPMWQMAGENEMVIRVQMRLPMAARVLEGFVSQPAKDVLVAKRSAALRACRRLYECGELDEHLMPYSVRKVERTVAELFAVPEDESGMDDAVAVPGEER